MDGNKLVGQLKKLSEVKNIKEITQLTNAMFPGTHCPLMGAAMAVRGIEDSLMVTIGTEECSYYTKHMTLNSDAFVGIKGRCVSVVLNDHDVTFGCAAKVTKAFTELVEEYQPAAVFLVTTCVVEIIGDDIDAVADLLKQKYGIPVLAVHTEHFKCENHLPGLERTISACFEIMEKQPGNGGVNLLGQRTGNFKDTELSRVLDRAGVKVNLQLPCGCSVEDIKMASAAKVNIVVNEIALPLAQKMKKTFGTPYIFFDKYVEPDRIKYCYQSLFTQLELPYPAYLEKLHINALEAKSRALPCLKGVSYIYGNTPFRAFEFNRFMVELGMVPQIIQVSDITKEDLEDQSAILIHTDPYVAKTANIAPLQYIYDVLKPMLYLGHEYAARLRSKGIALVRSDGAGNMLGFEVTEFALKALTLAVQEVKDIRNGGAA